MPSKLTLADLRREYHRRICEAILGRRAGTSAFNISDKDSKTSVELADGLVRRLGHPTCGKPPAGQTAGAIFATLTKEYLEAAFSRLAHLRPGTWEFSVAQSGSGIAKYDQYEHLSKLQKLLERHKNLAADLGGDYLITPDIVIARTPVDDSEINSAGPLIGSGDEVAKYTPLRKSNVTPARPILHATISCKWTMRSDRAQNIRTEALNLLRNRKGRTPHIIAVTLEPMPTRLASIAMGTGDIDCTYHSALQELIRAVEDTKNRDQLEMLEMLVAGRRLRDISDLPFDLAA